VFDAEQIEVLHALQKRLQGRTRKQQNHHPPDSLAWASPTSAVLAGLKIFSCDFRWQPEA
jgi:hypothetical protein